MPFVNARISPEDRVKYRLDEEERRFGGDSPQLDWVIDRERDIYLRCVRSGGPWASHMFTYALYWKGQVARFDITLLSASPLVDGHASSHQKVTKVVLPPSLEGERQQILDTLRDALTAQKDGGLYSRAKTYSLKLDF